MYLIYGLLNIYLCLTGECFFVLLLLEHNDVNDLEVRILSKFLGFLFWKLVRA